MALCKVFRAGIPLSLVVLLGAAADPEPSPGEQAIRAAEAEFVRDYNRGDSKALAARFTEDAEVVEAEGDRDLGREQIEHRFAETFAANPGVKLALEIESIRFPAPDVAQEEGRTLLTPAQGAPVSRRYTVLYIRREGRWLISSVREEVDPLIRPHDRLAELEWMTGHWIDEGSDSVVRLHCRWSEDGNFLLRDFSVKLQGRPVMSVTQRIGYDPLARQIRSWEFDSEGGFGEGKWSRDGTRWVIKYTGIRPEGTGASATNIVTLERPDVMRWVSTDRVIGDHYIPEEMAYVLVRVPPPPRLPGQGEGQANSPSSSTPPTDPTRRPR